jgi:signal recognition particle receptor subunit beta
VVFFNYTTMQMTAKVVYYGPGLCGKTTNLQAIHQRTAPQSRGEMVSLETETDRTLFFDLLPLDVGVIGGMKVRLQLYTVPGQVFYNATRKLVLKGVDGIVFVADSQAAALDANIESLSNLKVNLAELNLGLDDVPLVFQYNKRDIRNIVPVASLNEALNGQGAPYYEAAALHGIGVFETLKGISRLAITSVRRKVAEEPKAPSLGGMRPPGTAEPPPAARPADVTTPSATPSDTDPLASLVGGPEVEFAFEDADKRVVPIKTKGQVDIGRELEKLRAMTTTAPVKPAPSAVSRQLERRLQELVPSQMPRQEMRRKASVEIPSHLLKSASSMKIHLGFDGEGDEELIRDALTVTLVGNRRLERLTLHIELDIKGKS